MNRTLVFGIALFFAIVGLSLVGSEKSASAGLFRHHGCGGCDCGGAPACDGGDCGGSDCGGCHGRKRCHGLFGKHRCHGRKHHRKNRCCGCAGAAPVCEPVPSCCGEAAPAAEAPAEPAAPEAPAAPAPSA